MPISVRELLEAGCHFGHQTHRWNPKMRPYIYGTRNGIYIIDLEKTAKQWAKAEKAVIETVKRGQKVLFVGTKPQAQEIIAEEAERSRQIYVHKRWLGGMLTNFKTIKTRIDRLNEIEKIETSVDQAQKISKKDMTQLQREKEKLNKSLYGIKNMTSLPGMVVVIDPGKEHIAVSEAKKLQIPVLAVTDTNCDPDGIEYMVPANDDALKSVKLFLHAVADACLAGAKEFEQKIQEETRRKVEADAKKAKENEAQEKLVKGGAIGTGSFVEAAVGEVP
jgi:small subunit ribosomal protein S2